MNSRTTMTLTTEYPGGEENSTTVVRTDCEHLDAVVHLIQDCLRGQGWTDFQVKQMFNQEIDEDEGL
jgi:hypothetical protein